MTRLLIASAAVLAGLLGSLVLLANGLWVTVWVVLLAAVTSLSLLALPPRNGDRRDEGR